MRALRTCVIVASHERQAAGMRARLAARGEAGVYPRELDFVVLADPEGGRVGSGGATVLAAVEVRESLASINNDRARLVGVSANLQGLQVTVS